MAHVTIMKDGTPDVGWTMKVALTCEHRFVDGVRRGDLLAVLGSHIEDPSRLNG